MMDKHISNSLIANSGLHFKTCEVTFNPEEPLLLSRSEERRVGKECRSRW